MQNALPRSIAEEGEVRTLSEYLSRGFSSRSVESERSWKRAGRSGGVLIRTLNGIGGSGALGNEWRATLTRLSRCPTGPVPEALSGTLPLSEGVRCATIVLLVGARVTARNVATTTAGGLRQTCPTMPLRGCETGRRDYACGPVFIRRAAKSPGGYLDGRQQGVFRGAG